MLTLLHPYIDGELDLEASLQVEAHLRSCPACALSHQNYQTLREGLRDKALYFPVPPAFEVRLLSSISPAASRSRRAFVFSTWHWWGAAATLALVAFLSWNLIRVRTVPPSSSLLAQEVIDCHIRSLMGSHLADVASSNRHTVKPWFNGKLDYSPPVKDLTTDGFPLIGGRLDYLDARPVAALVYRHQKHFINVFVWPARNVTEERGEPETVTSQGYHVLHWEEAGMIYWSVSDLETAELTRFAELMQAAVPAVSSVPAEKPH